ncbi:hypothetical protein CEP53_008614 [Fusarium sp. AF-6]|nr:hypothetical protein CEP53_008614 [Fusarium sp. AF-6]
MDLLHHVRTCTLEDLETALSPIDFWYSYALPLAHNVEAVKYAICALGGAHRAFKSHHVKEHPGRQELQHVAFHQYNQAIRCVKSIMDTATERDMEVILTCCVVFISVENLHGRYTESIRHFKAGTSLLISLMNKRNQLVDFLNEESDGRARITPKFLDDIAQALCRLGNDVWGYIRKMIAPDLNFYATTATDLLYGTAAFTSVSEAEESFHNVSKLFEANTTVSFREMVTCIQNQGSENHPEMAFMPPQAPENHHIAPSEELQSMFRNWSKRFDLFRLHIDENKTTSQEILRTRALAVDQALWSGWLKCKIWADYQQEDYEEILRRAEALVELDAFRSSPVFAFDGSLILSLVIPCVSSMDCDIQWRTIRLLRSFWRREGIWDSQELADILEAMMIATSRGMVIKGMLPWDIPHLAGLIDSLKLSEIHIPEGPLLLLV